MPRPTTLEEALKIIEGQRQLMGKKNEEIVRLREQTGRLQDELARRAEKVSDYRSMVMQKNVEIIRLKGANLRLREELERRADEPAIVEEPG